MNVLKYIGNNKIKSTLIISGIGFFAYYFKQNYKKLQDYSKKIYILYTSEKSQKDGESNKNSSKANTINELLIFNNSKIKQNIYEFLDTQLKINDTKLQIKNTTINQSLQIQYTNQYKNKTIIFFCINTILIKYFNIISITTLSLLSIIKNRKLFNIQNNINDKINHLLLDEIWNISVKTSKNIYSNLSDILYEYIEKIELKQKLNKEKLNELFFKILELVRNSFDFINYFTEEIKIKINNVDNCQYMINSKNNNELMEFKLRFFYLFCDVIYSDLFYSSFIESYENDIKKKIQNICENIYKDNSEKSILNIIFLMDKMKVQQNMEEKSNEKNKDKKEEEENDIFLLNYQKCLLSIDL